MTQASNPRSEAHQRLGGRYEVRVLEPSPPAVDEPPWFADDPVARGDVAAGRELVSPVSGGDLLWEQIARDDDDLAAWCRERWLGPYRRLGPAPDDLAATRVSLHRLAEHVLSPARERANGKIALRYVRGGFGTPFFGDDVQLRVGAPASAGAGPGAATLTVQTRDGVRAGPATTLAAARELLGAQLAGPVPAADLETDLPVSAEAFALLADWFGFAYSVLEQLRAEAADDLEPSRVQLWAEHFDVSVELGSETEQRRAGYGASPGDELHPEPYLYVAPWAETPAGELWKANGFSGAELGYADLIGAGDQRGAALEFFRARLLAL